MHNIETASTTRVTVLSSKNITSLRDKIDLPSVTIYSGEANSGKTYSAIEELKLSKEGGWYLAPLRLLALEIYERMNREGFPCHLLTGEEKIIVPGALFIAATVEMFSTDSYYQSEKIGQTVVLDEAQLIADSKRGGAWTRVLLANHKKLLIACSPNAVNLIVDVLCYKKELLASADQTKDLAENLKTWTKSNVLFTKNSSTQTKSKNRYKPHSKPGFNTGFSEETIIKNAADQRVLKRVAAINENSFKYQEIDFSSGTDTKQKSQAAEISLANQQIRKTTLLINKKQRFNQVELIKTPYNLYDLPDATILVAFSRKNVLHLKGIIEKNSDKKVSVIYGNLPPEVRRKQADRFASGEAVICIATDAVGLGLNLPAEHVCFAELIKFDGQSRRILTCAEFKQIAGRAGRYGLKKAGYVGALTRENIRIVERLYNGETLEVNRARTAPSAEDLQSFTGNLTDRLEKWKESHKQKRIITGGLTMAVDLDRQMEIAKLVDEKALSVLGIEKCLQMTKAPWRNESFGFVARATKAIIRGEKIKTPGQFDKATLTSEKDISLAESSICHYDSFLWYAGQKLFQEFTENEEQIIKWRNELGNKIDTALLEKVDTRKKCVECSELLSLDSHYAFCANCYY